MNVIVHPFDSSLSAGACLFPSITFRLNQDDKFECDLNVSRLTGVSISSGNDRTICFKKLISFDLYVGWQRRF